MKIKLPLVGNVLTGKDIKKDIPPVIQAVSVPKKKNTLLGTFLDMGSKSLSDEKTISNKLLESFYEWVYINVTALAEEISKLEPELFKIVLKGGKYELQEVETHPLLDLLDRFNETTTQSEGIYVTEAHLELAGDSFWYLEGGEKGGLPSNIYILQPDKVKLHLGNVAAGARSLVESYEYRTVVDGKEVSQKYKPEEILHMKVPNPKNPYRGFSVVEGIANTLDIDVNTIQAARSFYENGMMAQFMLTTENKLTQDQLKKLKAEMQAAYSGSKNFWKVPIFGGGIKPETVQVNSKDAEMLGQQMWLRDKIMAAFKNTKSSLGITEDVNRANAEASILGWKRSVIKPKMCRIIDSLNEFLVPRYGDNLVLGFKDPVPEDQTSKVAEATQLYAASIITLNEARDLVGYDDTAEGDNVSTSQESYSEDNLPKSLEGINFKAVLRRNGLIEKKMAWQSAYRAAKPLAKQIVETKKDGPEDVVIDDTPKNLEDSQKLAYQEKQIQLIDQAEHSIKNKMEQYFKGFIERVSANVERNLPEKKMAEKDLFDKHKEIEEIKNKLMPTFLSLAGRSGSDALGLIRFDKAFDPSRNYEFINAQVGKFADSLLETDRNKLVDVISSGLKEGNGPAKISRTIRDEMPSFTNNQANTIARTEALRTSNHSAIEAWKESGVVVQKEWLCDSNACDYCAPLNGQKVGLEENYFEKGDSWFGDAKSAITLDYGDVEGGNLHPNCECTIVPVVVGTEDGAGAMVAEVGKVWHAEGYDPGQPMLGKAFYVSRSKEGAAPFGDDISSFKLELPESKILKLTTQDQLVDLKKAAIKKYGPDVDFDTAIPNLVKAKGFEAAEATFDPLGGIAVYNMGYIPQNLIKSMHIEQLEKRIDKRTKQYRKVKGIKDDQTKYIKELEKLLGVGDDHEQC